jgi:nucleoside-diphosphate-sugar epimerase
MTTVFLTGSTGMIGSNLARLLAERGDFVRALVRPGSPTQPLEELGVEIIRGDITNPSEVLHAAEGSEYAIHSAAVLGGVTQVMEEFEAVNVRGAINVYDAAAAVGIKRVVALSTTTFFDMWENPLTEHSPLDPSSTTDPYTLTKRRAYLEAMWRVDRGQDICIVISGGAYGTSPLPERSMVAPSFNQRATLAIQGQLTELLGFPIPWVFADDVAGAAISALDRGVAGERYLGFGRPEDVCSMAAFCNLACEIAGSPHRVHDITRDELDDADVHARYGSTLIALARHRYPDPWFRYDQTVQRLDYEPISLEDGLRRTIAWLRDTDLLRA